MSELLFMSLSTYWGAILFILNAEYLWFYFLLSPAFSLAIHVSVSPGTAECFICLSHFLQLRLWHRRVGDRGRSFAKVRVRPYLLVLTPVKILSDANTEALIVLRRYFRDLSPYLGSYGSGQPLHYHAPFLPCILMAAVHSKQWLQMSPILCYCLTHIYRVCISRVTSQSPRHLHSCVLS